ncbi:hypothetical protein TREMEDRAFT_27200 [Tremella mesenterica DSM 1558]|uniref:uncharacterized protein n=1 Tax=Tremella mesenterica (strain ATCC 24925 / CBS 8224 / DSM 1558 / NBRC 9311 / NRRL Y-6157 / RJB 2259-6 / UBC 559-6) TaxID=578456 RepID=UPI0003F4976D|nr:uncharacterized protein TREMEDRAFT_27200 [Tremella mesenterica DSM 1558]EIW71408.1 hypothetical protein TREMEDRAFT_27200 [Tremella mesenterica DSM 1558]
MNISFLLLLIVLLGLGVLTEWNMHVLILLAVTMVLWVSMVWFVIQVIEVPARPDNMPIYQDTDSVPVTENKKDR